MQPHARVTTALQHLMELQGIRVWPYLVGLAPDLNTARKHLASLRQTMNQLGLEEAHHKATEPTQSLVWIGILFDLPTMTMSIPPQKIEQTLQQVQFWLSRTHIPVSKLQTLIGQLAHIVKCCPAGRTFMARLYDTLARQTGNTVTPITVPVRQDLRWFRQLLPNFTGVRLMRQLTTHLTLTADACLTGIGAVTTTEFYSVKLPLEVLQRNLSITLLEMLNILVAARLWAHTWSNKNIMIFSDNMAVVVTLQAGRAHNGFLRAATRELWFIAAKHDIHIVIRHRPGASQDMATADALSRAHLSTHFQTCIQKLTDAKVKQTLAGKPQNRSVIYTTLQTLRPMSHS